MMENAPGPVAAPARGKMPSTPSSDAFVPPTLEARARPEDVNARTQFDSFSDARPAIPGASTDLGASRDTTVSPGTGTETPARSPLVFLLPAAALALIGGGLIVVAMKSKDPPKPIVATSQPPASAVTALPPPAESVATTPSASASTVAVVDKPPASASAVQLAKPPPVKPPAVKPTTQSVITTPTME
jgi:hypothetical protein